MNPRSDESLMAYVDGELDAAARAEVERAIAADAGLRERVAALGTQRKRLAAAFAPVLDEPMPGRLSSLLTARSPSESASVSSLDAARAVRAERTRPLSTGWRWAQWGGMAASLVLGVMIGTRWGGPADDPSIALQDGRAVAAGAIDKALSTQLASGPRSEAAVAVQLSFVDKSGRYCRSFSSAGIAGLACKQGSRWVVQTLAAAEPPPPGGVRQAASALPRAVLEAVDERIDGAPLDAPGEKSARDRGWQR